MCEQTPLFRDTWSGKPVGKKNSQRILRSPSGKPYIAQSVGYINYEAEMLEHLSKINKPPMIEGPAKLRIVYYLPDRLRRDITNLEQSTCDILVKAGVIKDDCWTVLPDIHAVARIDRKNPRAEIAIYPILNE